jgi:hypothetical protein
MTAAGSTTVAGTSCVREFRAGALSPRTLIREEVGDAAAAGRVPRNILYPGIQIFFDSITWSARGMTSGSLDLVKKASPL